MNQFTDNIYFKIVAKYNLVAKYGEGNGSEKGWLPFTAHLLDTAEIMARLINHWLPKHIIDLLSSRNEGVEWDKLAVFLALVHDIGKATPVFQAKISDREPFLKGLIGLDIPAYGEFNYPSKLPHALAGETILFDFGVPQELAAIIGSHHGAPYSDDDASIDELIELYQENFYGKRGVNSQQGQIWQSIWKNWLAFSLEYVGYQSCDELPAVDVPSQMLLSGLLMMADWIASNSYYAPLIPLEESFDNAIYPQRIDELWDKLALPDQWLPYNSFMDEEAFKERYGFLPNAMQRAMLQIAENADSSGIYIIEAQMGLGKTEAALSATEVLAAKWSLEGVFFGLPTQATANGIFPRMKAWVESMTDGNRFSIKLIHENAMLQKDYRELLLQGSATQNEDAEDGGLIVHNWFEGRKQALLTSFVIGTVDQMLMAALQQKHVMLRHLGLAGKVVIVDECHAYDAYMNCYLERALEWLGMYDIPVILLSATLPSQRRVKLMEAYHGGKFKTTSDKWKNNQAYPLITYTDGDEIKQCEVPVDTKSKRIVISKSSLNDVAPILKERLLHGGSAGVILNTVNQAQKTAELLQREFPDYEVVLLHARFTMADRQGLEEKVLQSLGKHSVPKERQLIVVGTQILEQSLDIDFDVMITQLAPMDLLLQRIGRLHRHEGRVRPKLLQAPICFVTDCGELDEGSKLIYGEWLLRRTNELLTDAIELPKDISPLVQETYRVLEEDSGLYECWQEQVNKQKIKEGKAKAHRILSKKELDETMHGLLNPHLGNREADALAQVRDGESAISVLLMVSKDEGYVEFLPWQSRGELLSMDHVPAAEECRKILLQKVQLPRLFSVYKYNACVSELEKLNIERLLEWQRSPWLKGELVLLLDENLSAELCGYRLQYSKQRGLVYEKEDQDGGERV